MTPRLPSKRRSNNDGDRPAKKQTEERTYDTYDEAMDGGVEMEDKGDRFRDGEKAERFYQQAAELYQKAMQFDENSYDAMYNLGRIQLLLASHFALPPSNLDLYSSAIALFHKAVNSTTDPFLKADAAFNLAQALAAFADVTDEIEGTSGAESSRELRTTATQMLGPVLSTQAVWLQGQEALAAQGGEGATENAEPTAPAPASTDEQMDVEGEGQTASGTRDLTHAPTPDALVDTVLLLVDIALTLWDTLTPPQPPTEGEQQSTREMLEMARGFAPAGRQAEIDLAESKVIITIDSIMWDMLREQIQGPDREVLTGTEMACKVMERILSSLDDEAPTDETIRTDILTTIANAEIAAAQRCVVLAKKGNAAENGQTAWTQLSQAATHLNTAVKLPVTARTPREFRPNCYIELLRVTLERARLAPFNETSARNAQALLDNCSAYGVKAAEALDWNVPRLPSSKLGMTPFMNDDLRPPYPSGWDMEMLARDLLLLQLRVCFYAMSGQILKEDGTKEIYEHSAEAIVKAIISVPVGPRRLNPRDLERFVGDIEDAEGTITPEENEWWKQVGQGIRKGTEENAALNAAQSQIEQMMG